MQTARVTVDGGERLTLEVAFPEAVGGSAPDVEVEGDATLLVTFSGGQEHRLTLPAAVDASSGTVKWQKKKGVLVFSATAASTSPDEGCVQPEAKALSTASQPACSGADGTEDSSCTSSNGLHDLGSPSTAARTGTETPTNPSPAAGPPVTPPPASPGAASVGSAESADDAALYNEFFCASPDSSRAQLAAARPQAEAGHAPCPGVMAAPVPGVPAQPTCAANAEKLAQAFAPTGGTASRQDGFAWDAGASPAPPPLPAGLPPVAEPIDCRYLAVANGLRVSPAASPGPCPPGTQQ
jgi:hypothetical protein